MSKLQLKHNIQIVCSSMVNYRHNNVTINQHMFFFIYRWRNTSWICTQLNFTRQKQTKCLFLQLFKIKSEQFINQLANINPWICIMFTLTGILGHLTCFIFLFCIDQSTSIKYTRTSSSITSEFRPKKDTCDIIVIIDYVLMFVFDSWSKISLFQIKCNANISIFTVMMFYQNKHISLQFAVSVLIACHVWLFIFVTK